VIETGGVWQAAPAPIFEYADAMECTYARQVVAVSTERKNSLGRRDDL
jgi:hypothetical protein